MKLSSAESEVPEICILEIISAALKNFVKMQHEYNCFFFIADYHSLTTHPTPDDLHSNVKQVLVEYLACGIDPMHVRFISRAIFRKPQSCICFCA